MPLVAGALLTRVLRSPGVAWFRGPITRRRGAKVGKGRESMAPAPSLQPPANRSSLRAPDTCRLAGNSLARDGPRPGRGTRARARAQGGQRGQAPALADHPAGGAGPGPAAAPAASRTLRGRGLPLLPPTPGGA